MLLNLRGLKRNKSLFNLKEKNLFFCCCWAKQITYVPF